MSRNPYIELYSFIGVGLGRELSVFEIFDLARFWTCNPSLGGYDHCIRILAALGAGGFSW